MTTRRRLSLVEYGSPVDLGREIAATIGVDHTKANSLLTDAGNRAAASLGLTFNPIRVDAKGARATDFAGLIRLAPSLELEVAPKFLGLDDVDAAWREDFEAVRRATYPSRGTGTPPVPRDGR